MNKEELKKEFRKKALKILKKKRVNNYKVDKILTNRLVQFIKQNNYKDIMLFIPLKSEVNTLNLIKLLRQNRYNIYVPFIENETFKLVTFRLPLKRKKFKIKEPNFSNKKIKNIDLAIIPLIGIDRNFKRVGFGKGMYDRFFHKNGFMVKNRAFLTRNLLFSKQNLTNKYDITADYIFTNKITTI